MAGPVGGIAMSKAPPRLALRSLELSQSQRVWRRIGGFIGHALLLLITSSSALAVLFIFFFIARDALWFFVPHDPALSFMQQVQAIFSAEGWSHAWGQATEFFGSREWDPTGNDGTPTFGALAIFVGSGLVTLGAVVVAVPLGIAAAVCLSDVLPFKLRQMVKPVIEVLAAIPSVAYGFFALIVFTPILQDFGGRLLAIVWWCLGTPVAALLCFVLSETLAGFLAPKKGHQLVRTVAFVVLAVSFVLTLLFTGLHLWGVQIKSGTNAFNVSLILGLMALPTIVSVSEDALQAVSRDLREGAYALGATRAEVLLRVVLPAARSGICAAVILGVMRAFGETMVVWMASGNATQIPHPWYNFLEPIRTLTATIAGDMGEADQQTGSARYHVLFAMAFALLLISFLLNLVSEQVIRRSAMKHR